MAAIFKSTASLRVFGDELDPDEVTRLLGRKPTAHYRKGEKWISAGREYERKCGMWRLAVNDCEPEGIDRQVTNLLMGLTEDFEVWSQLTSRFDVNIFCGLFMEESNEGFSLATSTLTALANRGIEIGFDIYAPTSDNQVPSAPPSDA